MLKNFHIQKRPPSPFQSITSFQELFQVLNIKYDASKHTFFQNDISYKLDMVSMLDEVKTVRIKKDRYMSQSQLSSNLDSSPYDPNKQPGVTVNQLSKSKTPRTDLIDNQGGIGSYAPGVDKDSISSRMNSHSQLPLTNLKPPGHPNMPKIQNQGMKQLDDRMINDSMKSGRSARSNISASNSKIVA